MFYQHIANARYACFTCRKSFVHLNVKLTSTAICPSCGGISYWMGNKFKSPRQQDNKAWEGLEKLSLAGYRLSHFALMNAEKFLDERERCKLESDPERRFLLNLKEAPRQDRKPAEWVPPPKKRKKAKRK